MSRARLAVAAALLWVGCGPATTPTRVGSKKFTEGVILGEVVTQLLDASGVPAVHERELGGTRILWSALLRGDLDLYPEYTGTLREEILSSEGGTQRALTDQLAEKGVETSGGWMASGPAEIRPPPNRGPRPGARAGLPRPGRRGPGYHRPLLDRSRDRTLSDSPAR
jgi:hypothetical protein